MQFKNLNLGFADAELEYNRKPEIFDNAFYDPKLYIGKLVDFENPKAILIGRKGVGKTAYSAKIRRDFKRQSGGESLRIDLSSLPYTTFSKITTTKTKVEGAQQHLHSWNILLIFEIINNVDVNLVKGNKKNFKVLKSLYKKLGFKSDMGQNLIQAAKKKFKADVYHTELSLEFDPQNAPEKVSFVSIIEMSNYIIDLFKTIEISTPLILIIDGVDDILRIKKQTKDILAGLIRCTFNLNESFYKYKSSVKFLLMLRDDIIKSINDPDFNKIIQDTSYKLDWYDKDGKSDLLHLINLRFKLSSDFNDIDIAKDPLEIWNNFFHVSEIKGSSNSWEYFLEHTLYRPRDVIQFVNRFVEDYPNATSVQTTEFKDELKKYSQNYFIGEMNNELSGALDDNIIQELPGILQYLGKNSFKYSEFSKAIESNDYVDNKQTKNILSVLFDLGYIGMLRNVRKRDTTKTYVNFKHKDPRLKLDVSNKLLIHKGLFYALNV